MISFHGSGEPLSLITQLDADNYEGDPVLEEIRSERGYNYSDVISVSPDKLPNYEDKVSCLCK